MTNEAKQQAQAYADDILLAMLNDDTDTLYDMPLSVQFRSGWYAIGDRPMPSEYEILLSWGGPSVKIVGACSDGYAVTAKMLYQDWGTEWEALANANEPMLVDFANYFMESDYV